MRRFLPMLLSAALLAVPTGANARNIVLTNDDGLTSNVAALYHALKAAGHDVIVAVPCQNQSGKGAALDFGRPLGALTMACRNGAAQVGDPGAGVMTRAGLGPDFHYVNGTPVMAVLMGMDMLAQQRWGAAPDLVLSGPNEGQNVGAVILSSGTVSAAQYAALRGIPAMALSAGGNTDGGPELATPGSPVVAQLTLELVAALEARAGEGPLLPQGLALNVNFPDDLTMDDWRASEIGTYNAFMPGFSADMAAGLTPAQQAAARERGIVVEHVPGLSFAVNTAGPTADQMNDESVVYRTAIAVSPMQAGYAPVGLAGDWLAWNLGGLLEGE